MITRVIVVGAAGRMGQSLIRAVTEQEGMRLVGATERQGSPMLGRDAGELTDVGALGIAIESDLRACSRADVLVDFTAPESTLAHARFAAEQGMRMVVGTTGFSSQQLDGLKSILTSVPVLMASNYSVGVNLTIELARRTASVLGPDYDAEIVDAHHRHKVDAPSGTALSLGESVAEGRGVSLEDKAVYARQGITGAREAGAIGFSVIRAGDIVGEHTVMFAGAGERLEIKHVATDRMTFAHGAIRGTKWLMDQNVGWYDMQDVLNPS
ncbi:MAG: 4-hydroxy-tetrahydrodipicolinate reductase [Mariprofundaceae bacterium]